MAEEPRSEAEQAEYDAKEAAYLRRLDDWENLDIDRYGDSPVGGMTTAELNAVFEEPTAPAPPPRSPDDQGDGGE